VEPARGHQAWKSRRLTITGTSTPPPNRSKVDQQQYRCDDLTPEDHHI